MQVGGNTWCTSSDQACKAAAALDNASLASGKGSRWKAIGFDMHLVDGT